MFLEGTFFFFLRVCFSARTRLRVLLRVLLLFKSSLSGGQKGAVLPSVCAVHSVRLRRAGGSGGGGAAAAAASVAAGPARTALNRFSWRLQSGEGERRAAGSVRLLLRFSPPSSSAATESVLRFLSRLGENEFEERGSPAWKFLCGLPWICLLDAEVRSVFYLVH